MKVSKTSHQTSRIASSNTSGNTSSNLVRFNLWTTSLMLSSAIALVSLRSSVTAFTPLSTSHIAKRAFVTSRLLLPKNTAAPSTSSSSSSTSVRMIGSIIDMLGGGKASGGNGLIAPANALPGRSTKMANIDGLRHAVLGNDIVSVPDGYQVAVYGSGCFWGSEKGQWRFPGGGIYSTAVGYCAGYTPNPTYEEACSGRTGHTEGVRVVYDPNEVSLVDILRWFWESHDPCSGMGQGNDRGTQYRSGFYYYNDEQRQLIQASKAAYEKALNNRKITTEIAAATDYDQYGGLWYYAEPYHQQYLAKPGARPYCSAQPQGVSLPPYDEWSPFKGVEEKLHEMHRPKLPESFWKQHGPKRGCSVVSQPNDPIDPSTY